MPDTNKLRLYLVSIQAIHIKVLPLGNQLVTTRHYPLILDAQSAKIAKLSACQQAEVVFPKNKGWAIRNGTVRQIPPEYYARILSIAQSLAESGDPVDSGEIFMCDDYAPKPQDAVILEFDKPPA